MKAFLDTSVLVPVFYGDHVHHIPSLALFAQFGKKDVACGAHSMVEVYSAMTRMPGKHRINGEQGMLFIENIRERLTVVGLTPEEYFEMLRINSDLGVVGGSICDALLAACALKSGAEKMFTWNLRHYAQFGPKVITRVQTPLGPTIKSIQG
jgi:predicted nucleic acid-binding protein